MGKIIGAIVVIAILIGGIMLLKEDAALEKTVVVPAPLPVTKPTQAVTVPVITPKAEEKMAEEVAKTEEPAKATETSPKVMAETAMADAEAARKMAASVGGEWRDIGKILKKSEAKMAQSDFSGAIKLANTAKQQAEIGIAQAKAQVTFKIPSYLKY